MDFYKINIKKLKSNNSGSDFVISPDFLYVKSEDLICKGGTLYAFWCEGKWHTELYDLIRVIDNKLNEVRKEVEDSNPGKIVSIKYMKDNDSGVMKAFAQYCKLTIQSDVIFNTKIFFDNEVPKKKDYVTNVLPYHPEEGSTESFDKMFNLLYDKEELEKILWGVGALLSNSMTNIQKFLYLYGSKGSGKGTIIKVIKQLLDGYWGTINLKHLTSSDSFATSQVQELPMLIDDDTNLYHMYDDINLLKMTGHDPICVNIKYREPYVVTFNGLLIAASNQRFRVRDIDSGITRRAIVVSPTSKKHNSKDYHILMERIKFEIPHVAFKAIETFNRLGVFYYEDYVDIRMAQETDVVYSFMRECYNVLGDTTTLKKASDLFKIYLEDLGFDTKGYKQRIKIELKRYYEKYDEQLRIDGKIEKNVYSVFKYDIVFPDKIEKKYTKEDLDTLLTVFGIGYNTSIFDEQCKTYPAQLATSSGKPSCKWDECKHILQDINTKELHYVRLPLNHIVIDLDIKDQDGNKDLKANLEKASKFPPTYTELSKSGGGLHLHYIYDGDISLLEKLYDDDVEIKVFSGKQSLRRKLTKCNTEEIKHISFGLPQKNKEGAEMFNDITSSIIWNEKKIRTAIKNNLAKKYHPYTRPSIDFIKHILKEAQDNDVKYDIRDMRHDIISFAALSTNQSKECLKIVNELVYCTIDNEVDMASLQVKENTQPDISDLTFFDIEVFPNLFVVVYKKYKGEKKYLINPEASDIFNLVSSSYLVGYNNRRYDNHILYAAMLGEDNQSLFIQSQRIINDKDAKSGMYSAAYELSYADIYDYITDKKSLKKWEIELKIHHDELELEWDKPVPEHLWTRVAEYCGNDVDATETVFGHTIPDYNARLILATLSGKSVNSPTRVHAETFLFGDDKRPQDKFIYTDLSEIFPGYKYEYGKSDYRGEDPSEGGYVYSEPGVYFNVALLDVASMHPTSAINLNYFGPYTGKYQDLLKTRLLIKHGEYDKASKMFDGKLVPFLGDKSQSKDLSFALKIIINIVYGLSSAKFDNKFRHPDNKDNIIAKRGALFMIDLKHAVQEKGYTVAHIKTDSIKIPNADEHIIEFVKSFGEKYGYTFELEAIYDKLALINKSVYVANKNNEWETVGAEYSDPYIFKSMFSLEEIELEDFGIVRQSTSPIYLGEEFIGKCAHVYCTNEGYDLCRKKDGENYFLSESKGFKWDHFLNLKSPESVNMNFYNLKLKKAYKDITDIGDITKLLPEENIKHVQALIG